ncbi:MAG TPA: SWIM zinc finger family protein [Longimicrobium sp.]
MDALIDIEAAGGLESGRLERGVGLVARKIGRGRYHVTGGAEEHWVDLTTVNQPRCDCGDHLWRERVCKHIMAALLREGDPEIIAAVGGLVRDLRAQATPPRQPRRRKAKDEGEPAAK